MQSLAAAHSARLAGSRASAQQQARPAARSSVAAGAAKRNDAASAPVAATPALAAFAAAAVLVRRFEGSRERNSPPAPRAMRARSWGGKAGAFFSF